VPPDYLEDVETRAAIALEQRRRARSAAQGVGTTFAGAALVIASLVNTIAVPLLIAAIGVVVAIWMFRRRVQTIEQRLGTADELLPAADGAPFTAVASALADLRHEAAVTEALLLRLRTNRAGVPPAT
jgi:hypothetical protein